MILLMLKTTMRSERFHMNKGHLKNLMASLVLWFYSFFTMFGSLSPSDFWQF